MTQIWREMRFHWAGIIINISYTFNVYFLRNPLFFTLYFGEKKKELKNSSEWVAQSSTMLRVLVWVNVYRKCLENLWWQYFHLNLGIKECHQVRSWTKLTWFWFLPKKCGHSIGNLAGLFLKSLLWQRIYQDWGEKFFLGNMIKYYAYNKA